MSITQQQLADAVWGTGYGSKKHLVDHAASKLQAPGVRHSSDEIHVRCSATITVADLDSPGADPWGVVATREPCARCQKIADRAAADAAEAKA